MSIGGNSGIVEGILYDSRWLDNGNKGQCSGLFFYLLSQVILFLVLVAPHFLILNIFLVYSISSVLHQISIEIC